MVHLCLYFVLQRKIFFPVGDSVGKDRYFGFRDNATTVAMAAACSVFSGEATTVTVLIGVYTPQ
jgi:hypothetical protein